MYPSQVRVTRQYHRAGRVMATAIDADTTLDPALVEACAAWFDEVEDSYREAGAIGPRPQVADSADPQARLLARFGRTA